MVSRYCWYGMPESVLAWIHDTEDESSTFSQSGVKCDALTLGIRPLRVWNLGSNLVAKRALWAEVSYCTSKCGSNLRYSYACLSY